VYDWLARDARFKAQYDDARTDAADALEAEAWRRAHDGVDEPVFYQGAVVGAIRRYSDSLLMLMLRAARPEKYRDRVEHTGKAGEPVPFTFRTAHASLTEKLQRLNRQVSNG
jgi:hypothetical protein